MPSSISSNIAGSASVTASLTGTGNLAASIPGSATVTAAIFVSISSTIAGYSSVSANLVNRDWIYASIAGSSTVTAVGNRFGNAQIEASIAGTSQVRAFFVTLPGPPPQPCPYQYATYVDAINALGSRLYDPTFQQWTQNELLGYIYESLRTWNALSQFWRSEMVFSPIVNTWWYDLRLVSTSIMPYTVKQFDIITQIENHLLEPPTPAGWTGSQQFSLSDITSALQRRQDDTLGTTACTLTQSNVGAAIGIRTFLPDTTIDIRRIAWLPISGFGYTNKILRQSDMWAKRAFDPTYTTDPQEPPNTWLQNTEPPPSFDVDRVPPVPGQYDVLTVNSGPTWTAGTNGGTTIPDDWTWVMKWGALFDLLSRESNAKDAQRAAYCKARYQEGLTLLENMPSVLALRMNNIPMGIDGIRNGDDFNPTWQSASSGPPKSAYTAANLLAFGPSPDSTTNYSATVSVIQNAPVGNCAYVQVARDDFDAIIDYAQHLAMFKQGGAEFMATVPLYQRFQMKAAQYNSKLREMGFFSVDQLDLSQLEERRNPRYSQTVGRKR